MVVPFSEGKHGFLISICIPNISFSLITLPPLVSTCKFPFAVQAAVAPQAGNKGSVQDLGFFCFGELAGLGLGDAPCVIKGFHALLGGSTVANCNDVALTLPVHPAFLDAGV